MAATEKHTATTMSSQQHRSSWSDLPSELMELILQKLTLMGYFKCRKVCQSWRTKVNDALSTEGRCPPKPHFPFLLSNPYAPDLPPNLLSLTENRLYSWPTQLDEEEEHLECTQAISEHHYHYTYELSSVDGWLLIQDYYIELPIGLSYALICFYNPVSYAILNLPKLSLSSDPDQYQTYRSSKLVVSSKIRDYPNLIAAIIVLIKSNDRFTQQLFFCKVTNNSSWTRIETEELIFSDIAMCGSKLYAITKDGLFDFVMVFDLSDHNAVTCEKLVMVDGPVYLMNQEKSFLARDSTCGELLLVLCEMKWDLKCDFYVTWPKEFRLFKLDMSGPRWLKVEHMNDRILLLDDAGIQVISATNLDGPSKSIRDNCIYFVVSNSREKSTPKNNFGVFSLVDNSVFSFVDNSIIHCHPLFQASKQSLWFSPNLW